MKTPKILNILVINILFFLPAFTISAPLVLQVNHDAKLTQVDANQTQNLVANTPFRTDSKDPMLISAPGKIPVLVVQHNSSVEKMIKVNMTDVKDWPNSTTQELIDQSISEAIEGLLKVQADLQNNQSTQALEKIELLQKRFPELHYLNFFKASAFVLQGKKSLAVTALKKALASHPKNEEGQKLLTTLGGNP